MGASGIRRGNPRAGARRRRLRGAAGSCGCIGQSREGGVESRAPGTARSPWESCSRAVALPPRQEDGGFPQPSCSALDLAGGGNH